MNYLFIVNAGSGNSDTNYEEEIEHFFKRKKHETEIYLLEENFQKADLEKKIKKSDAQTVVAVGGDGTIKLVAEIIHGLDKILGIIPAGSANGMAKELAIPTNDLEAALETLIKGETAQIHLVKINDEYCIHLADLGFNAYLVKKFDTLPQRGMWGYAKAAIHALINHKRLDVVLSFEGKVIRTKAAMVVIANATMYGTGLKINPKGKLTDRAFEVVVVKDYSYLEILKIWFTKLPFNPKKIAVYQTESLDINTRYKAHLQIDGEYLGKKKEIKASIIPAALSVITGTLFDESEL